MRTWLGQQLSVGDKVYKAGQGGSSIYFYVGEVIKHRPGSDKISVVEEIHPGYKWIGTTPKTNIKYPAVSKHWKGGPPRPTSIGLHTVLKLDDQQYKDITERVNIAADIVDKAEHGAFGQINQQQFNDLLEQAWVRAGL